MSDYMFMLESHLTPLQSKVVAAVDAAAQKAELPLFLTGGAMRDMLGGFPISDLDFTVQGNALRLGRAVASATGAEILSSDTHRKSVEMRFPEGVTAEISMARAESFSKPAAKPQVRPAPIHEDLLRRDFSFNSIALSLHPASRGLLLDPTNGLGDLEQRYIRTNNNYSFYDDPVRMLRLIRFRVRLGFDVDPRTQQQYENAREAEMERHISTASLYEELRNIASEPDPGGVLAELGREKLITLFQPALTAEKLNLGAFQKLHKAKMMIPFGVNLIRDHVGLFLHFVTEKLSSRERASLVQKLSIPKADRESWQQLGARSRKLERELKSPKLSRPSHVYRTLREAPGEQTLFLYMESPERIVHDRIRNHLQKYLLTAQEVNEKDLTAAGFEPGTAEFYAAREELIEAQLDGRKWRPPARPETKSKPSKKVAAKKKKAAKKEPATKKPKAAAESAKTPAKPAKPAVKKPAKAAAKKPATKAAAKKTAKPLAKKSTAKKPSKSTIKKVTARKAAKPTAKKAATKKVKPPAKKAPKSKPKKAAKTTVKKVAKKVAKKKARSR